MVFFGGTSGTHSPLGHKKLNLKKGEANVTARGNNGCGRRRNHPSSMIFRPIKLARCRRLSMWSP